MDDRLKTLGLIAGGILHEIANPLSALTLTLGVATEDLDNGDTSLMREHLETAHAMANVLVDIVRDMRTLTHGGTKMVKLSLNDIVCSAVRIAEPSVRLAARVRTDLAPDLSVVGVPGLLAQVVVNLVVNAAQAMPEAARGHTRGNIVVTTKVSGDLVMVEVSDDGQGIAADRLASIFEPFTTTKAVGDGSGLGLAICRAIMRQHGGELAVKSELGRGCTMTLSLPNANASSESFGGLDEVKVQALIKAREFFRQHVANLEAPIDLSTAARSEDFATMRQVLGLLVDDPKSCGVFFRLITQEPGWQSDSYDDDEAQAYVRFLQDLVAAPPAPPSQMTCL